MSFKWVWFNNIGNQVLYRKDSRSQGVELNKNFIFGAFWLREKFNLIKGNISYCTTSQYSDRIDIKPDFSVSETAHKSQNDNQTTLFRAAGGLI